MATVYSDKEMDAAFEQMAESYGKNATFPEGVKADMLKKNVFFRFLAMVIRFGTQGRVVGWAGHGKTAAARWFLNHFRPAGKTMRTLLVNCGNDSFDQHVLALPVTDENGRRVLEPTLNKMYTEDLGEDTENVILFDDKSRSPDLNEWMQVETSRTLLGVPIKARAVISLDNPSGSHFDVEEMDFTQADRSFGLILGHDDTPWRLGLAALFPDDDLNGVFRVIDGLTSDARQILSPRTLEYMIKVLKAGLPGELALPATGPQGHMKEHRLFSFDGTDITERVIADIARELGAPNPKKEHVYDLFGKVVEFGVKEGINVLIFGDPGVGKTSATEDRLSRVGFSADAGTLWSVSAAGLGKEFFSVPFRGEDGKSIQHLINSRLANPNRFVILFDEVNRGGIEFNQASMPLYDQRRTGNQDVNLVTIIALANPPKTAANSHLDVGDMDLALGSRFGISLRVGPADIDWKHYLRSKYGEEFASHFIEWWEEDLDEVGRSLVTPRGLERMMMSVSCDADPQQALPIFDGEYVRVSLELLRGRLDKRAIPRLRGIAAEADAYAKKLAEGEGVGEKFIPADPDLHERVYEAFTLADLDQLEGNRDALLVLMPLLQWNFRMRLIEASKLQQFWTKVLLEGSRNQKK